MSWNIWLIRKLLLHWLTTKRLGLGNNSNAGRALIRPEVLSFFRIFTCIWLMVQDLILSSSFRGMRNVPLVFRDPIIIEPNSPYVGGGYLWIMFVQGVYSHTPRHIGWRRVETWVVIPLRWFAAETLQAWRHLLPFNWVVESGAAFIYKLARVDFTVVMYSVLYSI